MKFFSPWRPLLLSLMAGATLQACGSIESRFETRDELIRGLASSQAQGIVLDYKLLPIYLQPLRLSDNSSSATIYIEGDGYAYINKSTPSYNPTPKTPVALELALQDNISESVFYMARPCQYIPEDDFDQKCKRKYWTTHRYGQEVVNNVDSALNTIKKNYGIKYFDLVGFSGGGNISGLLATKRTDITSIRTVAGNLDNDFFTKYHEVSDMPYSLNMANYAQKLSDTPQIHFISRNDKFVPPKISESYKAKLSHKRCTKFISVPETTHLYGWTEQWPQLVTIQPSCK